MRDIVDQLDLVVLLGAVEARDALRAPELSAVGQLDVAEVLDLPKLVRLARAARVHVEEVEDEAAAGFQVAVRAGEA